MAKKKRYKLPKRIAGIKLPKALRKSGGYLLQHLDSAQGRELLAAGLGAMAAALASSETARSALDKGGKRMALGASAAIGIVDALRGALLPGDDQGMLKAGAKNAPLDRAQGEPPLKH